MGGHPEPRPHKIPLHALTLPLSPLQTHSPPLPVCAPSPEPQLSSTPQRPGWRSEMAMALASERMALASSTGYSHVSVTSAPSPSLSIARWSHCRTRTAGAAVTAAGLRLAGVSSAASFVCKSSVRPLSDANGNVSEFQSEEEFNAILSDAGDKLVVVDISTTTCGPCKMIFPKLVEMSLAYPDAVFVKINGNTNADSRALMRKWGVRAVPNFRFFKKGEQVHSHTGAKIDELKTRFAEHYGQPIKV